MITEISTKPSDIIRAMRLFQKRKHSPTETPRLKKATTTARTLHNVIKCLYRNPSNKARSLSTLMAVDTKIDTPHKTKLKTNAMVRAYSTSFQLTSVRYATIGIVCSGFNMRPTSRSVIARHRYSSFVGG